MRQGGTDERPAVFFDSPADFRAWLTEHHDSAPELWMGLHRKHVVDRGLTWEEAVPEALCFGWIDSVAQRIDEDSRRQRWTPRRKGSTWSAVNVAHVERLTAQGLMHPAGTAAFDQRREDRTATYTYENAEVTLSPERMSVLRADRAAWAFWEASTATYRRLAGAWVESAKQEATRDKRLAQLTQDCSAGRLIPPQRYGQEPSWVQRAAAAAAAAQDPA